MSPYRRSYTSREKAGWIPLQREISLRIHCEILGDRLHIAPLPLFNRAEIRLNFSCRSALALRAPEAIPGGHS